jgi:hypothetical protein
MSNKAQRAASAQQQHSAETILQRIEALPPEEKEKVIDAINGDPANRPVNELLRFFFDQQRFAAARLKDSIPKRKMTPANRETLENYDRLLKEWKKQIIALRKLVKLPAERNKNYARAYRRTDDIEAVRQHVKGLRRTARKHQQNGLI